MKKSKNYLETAYNKNSTFSEYAKNYIEHLYDVLSNIPSKSFEDLKKFILNSQKKNSCIYVIGNGGSATTASAMANDLVFDILKKTHIKKTFKIISLTDNTSTITAISNDIGYENVFLSQLKCHYTKGDNLIVISASGNSPNLIKAANWIKSQGGNVFGLLGFDGGKLLKICNKSILAKTLKNEYGPVEDCHLILNHILAHYFQNYFR